jgi:predicted metal-dependent hydrolase
LQILSDLNDPAKVKQEFVEGLGPVHLTKRKHSKRITVRYDPDGKIKVSLPTRVSYKTAMQYLLSHQECIQNKISSLQKDQFQRDLSNYQTRWHEMIVQRNNGPTLSYQINQGKILLNVPQHMNIQEYPVQRAMREALETALRSEAKYYLPRRLSELANKHQLSFNRVYIKKTQSLWGSCSAANNINLNIHLMRLPDHLIDYVLNHELCHTIHKNHGPLFWNYLQQLTDEDVKVLRQELNQYSPKIF